MTTIEKLQVAFIILALISIPLILAGAAYMESSTYNKLTGAETTWWDALWVELRVQDNPIR
jgi:hypothetical protein